MNGPLNSSDAEAIRRDVAELPEAKIESIMYMGAGVIDQSTAASLLSTAFGGIAGIEPTPGTKLIETFVEHISGRIDDATATARLEPLVQAVAIAEQQIGDGSARIPVVGYCMAPVLPHGAVVELDESRSPEAGELTLFVSTLCLTAKGALYLGQFRSTEPVSYYREATPTVLYLFFQREPACIIAVGEDDLVNAKPLGRIHMPTGEVVEPRPWSFDLRHHPDLVENYGDNLAQLDPAPPPFNPVPLQRSAEGQLQALIGTISRLVAEEAAGTEGV